MEQLTRLHASRKGFKSHVTCLYNKVDELMEKEIDKYSITLLTKAIEQLTDKGDKLDKINEQIVTLIDDPHNLEEYIVESEELKDDIADKITHVQTFIELQTTKFQERNSQIASQSQVSLPSSTSQSQLETSQSQFEASQSQLETSQSQFEASQSQLETSQSQFEASQSQLDTR